MSKYTKGGRYDVVDCSTGDLIGQIHGERYIRLGDNRVALVDDEGDVFPVQGGPQIGVIRDDVVCDPHNGEPLWRFVRVKV